MHKRRKAILDLLLANKHRNVPYREILSTLKLRTLSNVKWHMSKLEDEGYIKITPRKVEVIKYESN